ncbi:MBL fold metallo-hydrolase [Sneathiella limimaris]|uniref:MBL fold metallo-hydrolase n=1 Tax=Sneathiella limimaris TaxID=1964213 RepID=UPI00146BCDCD|nr:MBL fold metallo-hydrolase [Sneathiella limimaris]
MKTETIFEGDHSWFVFGRDPEKPENIIDTNQYLVKTDSHSLLMDPGGIELFAPMLAAILHQVGINQLTDIFASHQDPDIISSLGYWDKAVPHAVLHAPAIWEGFLRHFGCHNITYEPIEDGGRSIFLDGVELKFIPAHYMHSSANFNVYDPKAKILMSGDIGAALEAPESPMFVEDFEAHVPKMTYFHQRWMPSDAAKLDWINRVRELDVEILAPQHGRMFKGEDVGRFLDWLEALPVGKAIG